MTREEWILSHQWRLGRAGGCIVCDPPGAMENCTEEEARDEAGVYSFYGGFLVLESCPTSVCLRIIRMHNCHDEVVEALRNYVGKFGNCGNAYDQARAALDKAEGK